MALQRQSMMPLDPSNFDFQRRGQRSMADLFHCGYGRTEGGAVRGRGGGSNASVLVSCETAAHLSLVARVPKIWLGFEFWAIRC
ncbi:hypothetical protein F383_20106 [Gossypium arboreum]|uniref:Uncharacterized protein n=1 Tax=Gossypium arboreum TaxID=29729 RepID=A0A0B0NGT3_GOSAR|nr:hypothetical protein F383_20106 [Gossypium arboreum]